MNVSGPTEFTRFVPAVAAEWELDADGSPWIEADATLCFIDISGFTNLSERLARRGRIGAEELTQVLSRVFGSMLTMAYERGGALLKFGGDALLLWFRKGDHAAQAASAAVEMRAALREAAKIPTSVGRVPLKMSVGVHTGVVHLFHVGTSHRELIIAGPSATAVIDMEGTADAGEIVISDSTRMALPNSAANTRKGSGWLLRWRSGKADRLGVTLRREVEPDRYERCVPTALRAHLGGGGVEPEHRIAVVGFVKFHSLDDLLRDRGAHGVASALGELMTVVQRAVEDNDVTFLATDIDADGGKVILTAGVPVSTEDDERRMLRSIRAITEAEPALPLKVGISRGHVFAGEVGASFRSTYTVMGDTVNLAARLMSAAPDGAAYVIPDVLDRSPTLFDADPLEPFFVKGKSAAVNAYSLGVERGRREAAVVDELPFAGRSREMSMLQDQVERVRQGVGGVVAAIGEAGAGKTRLVREGLRSAGDLPTLSLRAEPYGSDMPYRPLRDAARSMLGIERGPNEQMASALRTAIEQLDPDSVPMLPLIAAVCHIDVAPTPEVSAIEAEFRAARTADLVTRLAALAAPGPAIVIVEDAHWMDEASAQLLDRLAMAAPENRWLYIVTRRDESGGYVPRADVRIELGPLDDDDATGLIQAATSAAPLRPHTVASIVERAHGNPLFLESILRSTRDHGGVETLPESLDAVVTAQIDALSPSTRRLLRYASVLGASFRTSALDALLADESAELDVATRSELTAMLEIDGRNRMRFRHQIVRDTAYEGLSYQRRRQLHKAAAGFYRSAAGDEADSEAEVLSLHYAMGGDNHETWRFARIAGVRAEANAANVEAAVHYERALSAARRLPELPRTDVADIWTCLGNVRELTGNFEAALVNYRRARRIVEPDEIETAGLLLHEARALERAGRYSQSLRSTATAVRRLEDCTDAAARGLEARALAFRATIRLAQERPREGLRDAQAALDSAIACDELAAIAKAYTVVDWAHRILGQLTSEGHAMEVLRIYEQLGDRKEAAVAWGNLAFEAYFTGEWDSALDYLRRSSAAFTEIGDSVQAAMVDASIGEILVGRRQPAEAEQLLLDAARTMRASGFVDGTTFAEIILARGWLQLGHRDRAAELLDQVITEADSLGLAATVLEATIHRAECDVQSGEPERALDRIATAMASVGEEGSVLIPAAARVEATAMAALGSLDEARAKLAAGLESATTQELAYDQVGLLETSDQIEPGGDADALARAEELASRMGIRPASALV